MCSWFNSFIKIVPVTEIVTGKSCGVNFDQFHSWCQNKIRVLQKQIWISPYF